MKVGIIGFAQSGKTTIFQALTGDDTPGKPGRIALREVPVPDERIDRLSAMYVPQKTIYATIQLADLPGKAPGTGGGFDPQAIGKMRELDLLVVVARAFESPFVVEDPDPTGEVQSMMAEFLLADMAIVEKKVARLRKEGAKGTERDLFEQLNEALENEQWLITLGLSAQSQELLSGYRFLTLKPALVVVNTPEEAADEESAAPYITPIRELGYTAFPLSAKLEAEISQLAEEEQIAFLADLGITATARDRFIQEAYAKLNLLSFFTVGEDEVRAWTVTAGSNAQEAAGKIHTDLSKRFIRAEHMRCEDLLELGSEAALKDAGKFSLKGKDYIVQDGDILHIRANA